MDKETMRPVAWMRTLIKYENTENGMLVFLADEDEHPRVPAPQMPADPKAPRRRFNPGEPR
jgi:hypothetical protein